MSLIESCLILADMLNDANERRKREQEEERRREREADEARRREREAAEERRRIQEEMNRERQKVDEMKRLMAEMERKAERDAWEHERQREKPLAELARQTQRDKMPGTNIGVFGQTSTGKSTMINSLIGSRVADVGVGETTKHRKAYQGRNCTYWDTPGRNDESTYTNEEYISFIKGLTRRLIIIQFTVKENSKLIRLLDNLGLGYDLVVNKFDDIEEHERSKFQRQIQDEIKSLGLEQMKNVFFLSAQHPKMFSDWLTMVNCLTEPSDDCKFD